MSHPSIRMIHSQVNCLQNNFKGAKAKHWPLYKIPLSYFFTQVGNPTSQTTRIQIPNVPARTYITYVANAAVAFVSMTALSPQGLPTFLPPLPSPQRRRRLPLRSCPQENVFLFVSLQNCPLLHRTDQ